MNKNKKGYTAIILGIVAVIGSLVAIISIQSGATYAYDSYTITFKGAEGYELCGGLTCKTGPDGKVANCTGSYSGICNSWSTTKCNVGASGVCNNTGGQALAITSNNIVNHVYTSDVTYYCLAGSSLANKDCNGARPSSSIPSSAPSSSIPSSIPSSSSSSLPTPSSIPENPPTGTIAIYMVWIIGLGALVYAAIYFRKIIYK